MLFNSFKFLLFFPIVTVLYFLLPHKYRWLLLVIASCIFYMDFMPVYILIIFFTICIDYVAGILIENAEGKRRRALLMLSIFVNVGILCVFKYYNFFIENIQQLLNWGSFSAHLPTLKILLPIGLSFHTFQAMSYTIEVYRGNQKAERHFGIYSLYVLFYPQLVAGPIERPQNLLHQFYEKHKPEYDNIAIGLRLMLWGMIKKVIVADRLAVATDAIFDHPTAYSGTALALGAIFFAFQIYCDFSGYSDIAIGAARVMGFKLMTNFNTPYFSRSISEFWKRWHISLSTWFKDYLYIPLGGNKVKVSRLYFNLFVVFLVSGFWHGANWTYICWGALHGFYLCFALATQNFRTKLSKKSGLADVYWLNTLVNVSTTFVLVVIAWIFFRANSMGDALYIVQKLGAIPAELARVVSEKRIYFLNLPGIYNTLIPCVCVILFLEIAQYVHLKFNFKETFSSKPAIFRWTLYYGGFLALIYFGVYEHKQFIYFQF